MKIVYFGSDALSEIILGGVRASSHEVIAVVTTPDSKRGRGQQYATSTLKQYAVTEDVVCLQPNNLHDGAWIEQLQELQADLFLVVSYGKILPQAVLSIPRCACINVHPSLLPQYRGPSPINYCLLNGDIKTGFTVIRLNERIDSGDILYQEEMDVDDTINAVELRDVIGRKVCACIGAMLDAVAKDEVSYMLQNEEKSSYAPLLKKEDGKIDWTSSAYELHNKVRAFVPWPSAYTFFKRKLLKIHKTVVLQGSIEEYETPGKICAIDVDKQVRIQTGSGVLRLIEVQMEGKNKMGAFEWATGQRIQGGEQLGN